MSSPCCQAAAFRELLSLCRIGVDTPVPLAWAIWLFTATGDGPKTGQNPGENGKKHMFSKKAHRNMEHDRENQRFIAPKPSKS